MAVAKRQRMEKLAKNEIKEDPRTGVRTSRGTNSPSGWPIYIGQAQRRRKDMQKENPKLSPFLL